MLVAGNAIEDANESLLSGVCEGVRPESDNERNDCNFDGEGGTVEGGRDGGAELGGEK